MERFQKYHDGRVGNFRKLPGSLFLAAAIAGFPQEGIAFEFPKNISVVDWC